MCVDSNSSAITGIDNSDFRRDFTPPSIGCAGLQFLFGLGFYRTDRIDAQFCNGPYYHLKEPDPLEDFEAYAAFTEKFEMILQRTAHVLRVIHDFSKQGNLDRVAGDVIGAALNGGKLITC